MTPESDSAMKKSEKNHITPFFLKSISRFLSLGHRDFSVKLERVVAPPKCWLNGPIFFTQYFYSHIDQLQGVRTWFFNKSDFPYIIWTTLVYTHTKYSSGLSSGFVDFRKIYFCHRLKFLSFQHQDKYMKFVLADVASITMNLLVSF